MSPPSLARRPQSSGAPAVSIVLPTYRRARQVGETVQALLSQTRTDFELIVSDDGDGTDGTEAAIRAVSAGDARVSYRRNPVRLAMPGNLNHAIGATRGQYVAICLDHDLVRSEWLARLVGLLERHPSAAFAFPASDIVDERGSSTNEWRDLGFAELTPGRAFVARLLDQPDFYMPVAAMNVSRRSAYEAVGLFDPLYGPYADWEMWMRLALFGDVAFAREALALPRAREADSPLQANPWPFLVATIAIHRRYREALGGRFARAGERGRFALRTTRLVADQLLRERRQGGRAAIRGVTDGLVRQAGLGVRLSARLLGGGG